MYLLFFERNAGTALAKKTARGILVKRLFIAINVFIDIVKKICNFSQRM